MDVAKIHLWANNHIRLTGLEVFSNEWVVLEERTFSIWLSLSEQERIHAKELKKNLMDRD